MKNDFFEIFSDKASVSKFLLGTFGLSHIALNFGMVSHLQKYLVCKIPGKFSKISIFESNSKNCIFSDSISKGELWRILSTKFAFLETKDAIFCLVLLYTFRIFERRLGSRKFASTLVAMLTLSGIFEVTLNYIIQPFNPKGGILAIGP